MTSLRIAVVAMLLVLSGTTLDGANAQSVPAEVTTNLRMRAGPSAEFPIIVVVPADTAVSVTGCIRNMTWCEVRALRERGWMSAQYLEVYDRGSYVSIRDYARVAHVPVIRFDQDEYWSAHYRRKPFYDDYEPEPRRRRSDGIRVGVFYERLSPHGSWVSIRGRYVWVPDVEARWTPYTRGRWVYTRSYGWMWVSDEPFGWATYHYGRWGYSHRVGWFWVPGTRWAPAWVAWRQSGDYMAWAPLPPDPRGSLSVSVTIGTIPDYYWQAVPTHAFLSVNLSRQVVRDPERRRRAIERTAPAGNVTIVNNVVVNNVIQVPVIEEKTNTKVVPVDVSLTSDPAATSSVQGQKVEIYHPPAAAASDVTAPPQVKPLELVEKESQTKDQAGNEPATEALVPTKTVAEELPPATEMPPAAEDAGKPEADVPAVMTGQEPCPKGTVRQDDGSCVQKKKSKKQATEQPQDAAPADQQQTQQPVEQKKKRQKDKAATEPSADQQPVEQKKKRQKDQAVTQPSTDQQPVEQKKKRQKDQAVTQPSADQQPVEQKKKRQKDQAVTQPSADQQPVGQKKKRQKEPSFDQQPVEQKAKRRKDQGVTEPSVNRQPAEQKAKRQKDKAVTEPAAPAPEAPAGTSE